MNNLSSPSILIVEPNQLLQFPYSFLNNSYHIKRCQNTGSALISLLSLKPELVFLSASFSPPICLKFLQSLKHFCRLRLVPLIILVDLSNRLNYVPGTTWGGRIAVLGSNASKKELNNVFHRLTIYSTFKTK